MMPPGCQTPSVTDQWENHGCTFCLCRHRPPPTGGAHIFLFTAPEESSMSCDVFFWSCYTGCISTKEGAESCQCCCYSKAKSLQGFLGLLYSSDCTVNKIQVETWIRIFLIFATVCFLVMSDALVHHLHCYIKFSSFLNK